MQRYHRIGILGATGGVGQCLARQFLDHTDCALTLIGRNQQRLQTLVDSLSEEGNGRRLALQVADASDAASLRHAVEGVQLLINATTAMELAPHIAGVCVALGCDYLEMSLSRSLDGLAAQAEAAGVALIDQAGFHPGLPAPLIRWAAARLDAIDEARVFLAMDADFRDASSTLELVDAVAEARGAVVEAGSWRAATYRDQRRYDFGPPFGRKSCFPLEMIELRELAGPLSLQAGGVYAAGFNWFVDYLVFPLIMFANWIRKGWLRMTMARLLFWGLRRFSLPGKRVIMALEGSGRQKGQPTAFALRIDTPDAFLLTAAPVVCTVLQLDAGGARIPGLQMMGLCVDAEQLVTDLRRFGLCVVGDLSA